MKILVVDDERDKIKNIVRALMEISGINQRDIEVAYEVNSARELLLHNKYEVLILDLNMPESMIDDQSDDAGQDFIDEIIGVESYNKPTEIVILSAYEECEKNFSKEKSRQGFQIIRYDESSITWSNRLKAIIQYRLLYSLQNTNEVIDFAIITTVPVETEAVRNLADKWEQVNFPNDPLDYYIADLGDGGNRKRVVNVQSSDMGMVPATISTLNIHNHFKPKYIFISGIAAGIGDHNLGDILIPSEVWNYSCGKYIEKDGKLEFLPEPKTIPLDVKLADVVRRDYNDVLENIHNSWPIKNETDLQIKNTKLKLYSAPLACGTSVVANFDFVKDFIINHSRKTQGIDMEAYGVFAAVRSICDDKPIAICVKAISDFADKAKSDGFQPYASYTSAMFIKHLILEVL